jgi:hypothetical protein
MEEIMIDGHIVYSNTALVTADGEVDIAHHTYSIHMLANSNNDVEVKLNGKHLVMIPAKNDHGHAYVIVPGDYNTIEVITAASEIAVFAVG